MTPAQGPSHRQPPWDPTGEGDAVSFGNWLRRERELRQVSLREISDETKISIRYLEALEEDRFDILPGTVFAKGFLRQYARYVGLDGDEVVNSYLTAQRGQRGEEAAGGVYRVRRRREWMTGTLLASGLLVLLAAVAALAFYAERSTGTRQSSPPPAVVQPRPAAPPPATRRVPADERLDDVGVTVTLDFDGECWVEAVVDGAREISELRVQGESLTLEGRESVELTLDSPDVVRMEVDGEPFDLSGTAAQETIFIEAPESPPEERTVDRSVEPERDP